MKINLPNQSSRGKDGSIHFHASINAEELKVEQTPFGVRIDLGKEYRVLNEPGTPSLPSKVVQVALPVNATNISVQAKTSSSKKLFKEPVYIMPVPEYEVGVKENGKLSKEQVERLKPVLEKRNDEARRIPSPMITLKPDPEKYNFAFASPRPAAELNSLVTVGGNCIAYLRINPVTIGKDYIPEFHEAIDVTVNYVQSDVSKTTQRIVHNSIPQPEELRKSIIDELKGSVINPNDILDVHPYPWVEFLHYNYIVITDNYQWDSETMTQGAFVGDLTAEFERLVAWKRLKGLRARVVTITDIMNNVYGNFRSGALDLQEVLRNFLKYAHARWGICWCLLGGDTEIIPIRQAAGECRGDVRLSTESDPPPDNKSFWTGSFLKIKAISFGDWFSIHDSYLKLTNNNTGQLIPKKAPRNISISTERLAPGIGPFGIEPLYRIYPETTQQFRSRLGWYFCTDETYTNYSATPTNFVRVDGDPAIINAQLRFHYKWNTIPTDFYYSSLFGPQYGIAGRHDWDFNHNGIYGQDEGANEFDPINWNSDICVGRAPASSVSDATVFVNKVIGYEQFRSGDGTSLDPYYVDKFLLVSSDWGGRIAFWPTPNDPPEPGRFKTQFAQNRAILQTTDDTNLDWNWQLISWINDNDVWLIPYNRNATVGVRGYYFAFSPTDLRPAVISITLLWGITIEVPLITHTVVIYGNASEIAPQNFLFDHVSADGSMMDQEALRQQVDLELPFVQQFNRLYEDIDSLPLPNRLAAPVSRLTSGNLDLALNEGQHFVSLSGHGNQGGCCMLGTWRARSITNNNKFFIAFADSCLTNAYEDESMSEALLNNPTGGAVAYVGHTRFSWIGVGDDYQRAFFHTLVYTRHLGLMHRSRLNILQANGYNQFHKWTVLALNLLGDPEMEVWKRRPFRIIVDVRFIEAQLYVKAWHAEDLARRELKNIGVKVYAGENEFTPVIGENGSFELAPELVNAKDFRVVVSADGSLPQTFTGEEILKLTRQHQVDVPKEELKEEQLSAEILEQLQKTTPLMPPVEAVVDMRTQPQSN